LELNEIGQVSLHTAEPVPVDDYARHGRTGAFLVIDPADGATLAAGLVGAPLPVRS
jgi:sulfate adenylyltransferase subunit 1